jgi:hypothetical protein
MVSSDFASAHPQKAAGRAASVKSLRNSQMGQPLLPAISRLLSDFELLRPDFPLKKNALFCAKSRKQRAGFFPTS